MLISLPHRMGNIPKLIMLGVSAWLLAGVSLTTLAQQANQPYQVLSQPLPTESGGKIEVLEFFSYGCAHCSSLEPLLSAWVKKAPADVEFRRVPVVFQHPWENLGKIFYVLEALGKEKDLSSQVFQAIHDQHLRLDQESTFFEWTAKQGLDPKKVEELFKSFSLASKISRAKSIATQFKVEHVPMIFVDGRYMTDGTLSGSYANVPQVLNLLVDKARASKKAKTSKE